jgi:hypothetical protein
MVNGQWSVAASTAILINTLNPQPDGTQVSGQWSMVNGQWSVAASTAMLINALNPQPNGTQVSGQWSMVNGQWSVIGAVRSSSPSTRSPTVHRLVGSVSVGQ